MGKGRKGSGVEPREGHIRIKFTVNGVRHREKLPLKPTPANIMAAERLGHNIQLAIHAGTFKYSDFFPDSPNAPAATVETVRKIGELFMSTKGRLADATKAQYTNALEFWYRELGIAEKPINAAITQPELAAFVGGYAWKSPKLCNNYLIPLRGLFALGVKQLKAKHGIVMENPTDDIENTPVQKDPPDPLSKDEVEAILADMAKHYPPQIAAYFEFQFFTGLRPEEAIALRWSDIDWPHRTARIERAKTFKGTVKQIKTHTVRDIELNSRALAALQRMRAFTEMKRAEVFENPVTAAPWHDDRSQRDHYWKPAFARTKVRYRTAYNTRHTYATLCLMSDCNPTWVARQLGHKDAKMLFSVYAKWIDKADKSRQIGKLEEALKSPTGPARFAGAKESE